MAVRICPRVYMKCDEPVFWIVTSRFLLDYAATLLSLLYASLGFKWLVVVFWVLLDCAAADGAGGGGCGAAAAAVAAAPVAVLVT